MKRALITGITGQDGSYLTELLLGKGYQVWGLVRRSSTFSTGRIEHLYSDPHEEDVALRLVYGDLCDALSLSRALEESDPDEVYNLGAQSHVRVSFDIPEYTADVTSLGAVRLLEAIRRRGRHCKFYQASSSEMFGDSRPPQNEQTQFRPRSPYAAAKAMAHYATVNYREAYDMHAVSGILFNHESPRRGETFVTRKITRAVARIKLGLQDRLYLGNLDARRDWGFAGDFVEAMWLMLQTEEAADYVVATGEMRSVRDFAARAFARVGLDYEQFVSYDHRYDRPSEVDALCGDASNARAALGWCPTVTFEGLVDMMVDADLVKEKLSKENLE